MTRDTGVQIGSTTKILNAIVVMSLVEDGRLELDLPVRSYIPELNLSESRAAREITLRHLLSMSAGVDNGDYADYGLGDDALAKRVAALSRLPQHFVPGSYFGYSNAGVDIAGYVATRVTGQTWEDLLSERVLKPASLSTAASLDSERIFQRISVGHDRVPESGGARVVHPWYGTNRGLAPSGTTFTISAHDLARVGGLFINQGVSDCGRSILSPDSIRTMMMPQVDVPILGQAKSWCLGPFHNLWSHVGIWGHKGGYLHGGSFLYWVPEKKAVLACTFNTPSAFGCLLKTITRDIAKAALGIARPEVMGPASPIEIDSSRYEGVYESLAGTCVVETVQGRLVMRTKWDFQIMSIDDTSFLEPLGNDRFLVGKGGEEDPKLLRQEMAFFGDDGNGRASNLIRGVFPARRRK
jgi:CubicO group peptidase (beta-lactamase class C family)